MNIEDLLKGGNLQGLMQQAQQMQQQMKEGQDKARSIEVVGESGGGLVKVTANGGMDIVRVVLDPICVDPRDIDMLQDLVTAATNDALRKAKEVAGQAMGPMANLLRGAGMPGA